MAYALHPLTGLLLAVAWLAGCSEEKATLLLVNVTPRDGVASPGEIQAQLRTRRVTRLEASFVQDGVPLPNIFSKAGQPIELPDPPQKPLFVVRADGWSGPVEVTLKAMDDYQPLGQGSGTGTLLADQASQLSVTLFPDDFGINEQRQGKQFFSMEAGFGRQVASALDGSFVAVWEDDCGALERCDIWYRLFDRSGTPRLNGATGKTDEHTANQSGNDVYDMPSVAAQENGGFLVAWQRLIDGKMKIYSRTFTADGRPDPSSNSGQEVEISGAETATGTVASVPHAIALKSKGYLVVWQQETSANNWELKGRYLGSNGVPAEAYNGSKEPFLIHSFTSTKHPWPMAAPGVNQGFMVVWNENGLVRARPFGARALPVKPPFDVDTTKTKLAEDVGIGFMPAGYAVVWSDTVSSGGDSDGSCIRIRRLDLGGSPYQPNELEYTLNTSAAGNQRHPAVATRSDGSLLVVWTNQHPEPDPEGGLRGRRVLHNFLPVGADFAVNTTSVGKQELPALAPHYPDSLGFIMIFVDHSGTYPDQFQSGIRGRLLYPEYAPEDGQIGAVCDPDPGCAAGLSCQATEAGPRCVAECAGPGAPCPNGGVCKSLAAGDKVCLYNK